jgi:hypothetical protein
MRTPALLQGVAGLQEHMWEVAEGRCVGLCALVRMSRCVWASLLATVWQWQAAPEVACHQQRTNSVRP